MPDWPRRKWVGLALLALATVLFAWAAFGFSYASAHPYVTWEDSPQPVAKMRRVFLFAVPNTYRYEVRPQDAVATILFLEPRCNGTAVFLASAEDFAVYLVECAKEVVAGLIEEQQEIDRMQEAENSKNSAVILTATILGLTLGAIVLIYATDCCCSRSGLRCLNQ